MNQLILIGILWSLAISIGSAQEADTSKDEANQHNAGEQQASASPKAIVLVIDADAQNSEVVKEVIAALEKAGIATGKPAETAPPTNSPISVTLNMRKDESYDKIMQLIEAIRDAGVQQMSIRAAGVGVEGEKEQNILILHLQQGFTRDELHKIESAATTKADQCGLQLFISTQHPAHTEAGEFFGPAAVEKQPGDDDRNFSMPPSSEKVIPGTNTATIPKTSMIAELREAYESDNKIALSLATFLRQAQNSKDPAIVAQYEVNKQSLRQKVHAAFTLRQSLLRAELQEMQARLEKTQQSLAMRDRIADQIVDRRVEDLLNPELNWDSRVVPSQPPTQLDLPNGTTLLQPAPGDSRAGIMAKLQGVWEVEVQSENVPKEKPPFRVIAEIRDNVMTWTLDPPQPDNDKPPVFLIKLGEPGTPQSVDLTMNPNDGPESAECPGIIEIRNDIVRICVNWNSEEIEKTRPLVFAVGKVAALWTLKRPALSPDFLGVQLAPAPVGPEELKGTEFRGGLRIETVYAGTPAAKGGMQAGDILVGLHVWEMTRLEDLKYSLGQSLKGEVSFQVLRDQAVRKGYVLLDGSERPASDLVLTPDQLTKIPVEVDWVHSPAVDQMLAKLQGAWDVKQMFQNEEKGELTTVSLKAIVDGNRISLSGTDGSNPATFDIHLGAAGPPQQVDLKPVLTEAELEDLRSNQVPSVNGTFPGIIEVTDDGIRFCLGISHLDQRPIVFAAGPATGLWELRRGVAVTETELEGDWHLVSAMDKAGQPVDVSPVNIMFRNDRYTLVFQGGQIDRRVEVYPDKREIRFFEDGNDSFGLSPYLLDSDQMTIMSEPETRVYRRGLVAIPKAIPNATKEQANRWRSGIVEIIVQQRHTAAEPQEPYGYGVIVSPKGMMISQLKLSDGDWIFFARFDDGGVIPIRLVEEGIQGWTVFQPEQPVEVNHHYRFSTEAVGKDDEVNFWGRAAVPGVHPTLVLAKSNVTALDRKSPALGLTVWQLHAHAGLDATLPILDGNGDVLAISAIGTGDLFLAVPVSQLKTMFPKSLGLLKDAEQPAEPETIR